MNCWGEQHDRDPGLLASVVDNVHEIRTMPFMKSAAKLHNPKEKVSEDVSLEGHATRYSGPLGDMQLAEEVARACGLLRAPSMRMRLLGRASRFVLLRKRAPDVGPFSRSRRR